MTKRLKIILMGVLVVALAVIVNVGLRGDDTSQPSSTPSSTTASSTSQADPNGTPTTPADAGKYVDYSESLLEETAGTRLLFFHAPWCPQCRQLEASIQAGGIPEDVTIFKVDYDTNQKLRQKYGVTIQTTIVKLGESTEAGKKFVAYDDPTLESVKTNLLQ